MKCFSSSPEAGRSLAAFGSAFCQESKHGNRSHHEISQRIQSVGESVTWWEISYAMRYSMTAAETGRLPLQLNQETALLSFLILKPPGIGAQGFLGG